MRSKKTVRKRPDGLGDVEMVEVRSVAEKTTEIKRPWRSWKHDLSVTKTIVVPFLSRVKLLKKNASSDLTQRWAKLPTYVLFGLECVGFQVDQEPWEDIEILFREKYVDEIETAINTFRFRPWLWPEAENVDQFDSLTEKEVEDCQKLTVDMSRLWFTDLEAPYTVMRQFRFLDRVLDQIGSMLPEDSKPRRAPVMTIDMTGRNGSASKSEAGTKRETSSDPGGKSKKVRTVTKTHLPFLRSSEEAYHARALKLLRKNLPPEAYDNGEPSGWLLEFVERIDGNPDNARDLRLRCMIKGCGSTVKISPQSVRSADGIPSPNVTPAKTHLLKCLSRTDGAPSKGESRRPKKLAQS
uniref:Uncharacterized protein n=1 Tax=Rhodosorus marinus TaxID=101924 RepID=A0A7S3A3U7_9RHOD|mmetsp:Transcript_41501/g.163332  ORF Transcript_41501/g.163332 Transcript_41501/m.163332 type:complete len:353 (+) Transcript_41501:237-1295(+)